MKKLRRAFTLVELLIVMAVILLVAAVTLPTVKDLLKDQKISQGTRVVQAFFESAKARAVATGRPVAVVMDRMYIDASAGGGVAANDTCVRMAIGEVFPPYEGDWAGALATITSITSGGVTIPVAQIAYSQAASLVDTGLVQPDDRIQFGDSRKEYRISGAVTLTTDASGQSVVQIPFENPAIDPYSGIAISEPTVFPSAQSRFRIFRKPSKSLGGSITFPRGICVDLSVSGFGPAGREFGAESISGGAPAAGDFGTVYVVFSPQGSMQDVYFSTSVAPLVRHPAGSTLHLLVGKTEQVFSNPATGYLSGPTIPSPAESTRDDIQYNILDSSNYWVSINPFSGAIYSSQVQSQTGGGVAVAVAATANARTAQARTLATSAITRVDQ